MVVFELVNGTSCVEVSGKHPVSEIDTGVLLDEECDSAPMVCPMVVVFPDSWIWSPAGSVKFFTFDNDSTLRPPTGCPRFNPIFRV